jgi:hypothetical protein
VIFVGSIGSKPASKGEAASGFAGASGGCMSSAASIATGACAGEGSSSHAQMIVTAMPSAQGAAFFTLLIMGRPYLPFRLAKFGILIDS